MRSYNVALKEPANKILATIQSHKANIHIVASFNSHTIALVGVAVMSVHTKVRAHKISISIEIIRIPFTSETFNVDCQKTSFVAHFIFYLELPLHYLLFRQLDIVRFEHFLVFFALVVTVALLQNILDFEQLVHFINRQLLAASRHYFS